MQWTPGNVWTWQTYGFAANAPVQFKVLIDDTKWEIVGGQATKNHATTGGATNRYSAESNFNHDLKSCPGFGFSCASS